MKKFIVVGLALLFLFTVGCSSNGSKSINLVSREDGSGTRGAFVEIVGILEKDSMGNEIDKTYEEAIIQNGTDAIMTTIMGDTNSIGYISLGSLQDNVKALKINGVEPSAGNIQNESYKISRPFNIVYNDEVDELRDDFIKFILSQEGQDIANGEGYVESQIQPQGYVTSKQKGNLTIAGSTSISPLMEKLVESYMLIHPDVSIEIQSTGSSAGVQAVREKSAHIGMVSRDLKDTENQVLQSATIALDGIVIIVNRDNVLEDIGIDDLKSLYIGDITSWDQLDK